MSIIDTDQVRSALRSAASAAGEAETFFDILIPVDDGRSEGPLKIGQMFGSDLIQHPDVPEGQMYIKRRPGENYAPQAMIDDLQESKGLLVELAAGAGDHTSEHHILRNASEILDTKILRQQELIQKGPKS